MKIRWVKRRGPEPRVLQQQITITREHPEGVFNSYHKWVDVPVEKE